MDETGTVRSVRSGNKRGGWITFPFIIGSVAGMSLAAATILGNMIVFLIREYNIKAITATQVANVANGTSNLFPILAAIVADSFFGSFAVASVFSFVSFLGTIILALATIIKSLRPEQCKDGSNLCNIPPSKLQYAVVYVGVALSALGFGGARFTTASLGANQLEKAEHQGIFFNWFFLTWYITSVVAFIGVFYVEDNVSWALGFGICAVATFISTVTFVVGYRFYRLDNPQGSAFLDLARVLVASARKCKCELSSTTTKGYYSVREHSDDSVPVQPPATPGKRLRFFNRAALVTDGDLGQDGSIEKRWRLCSVEQVEDFKTVIGILPLWSSSILLATPIAVQNSLTVLQALATDRHIGSKLKFPAGSITVMPLISTSIFLTLLDRVVWPTWQKLHGRSSPTPLQRIGVGHVLNVLSMVVSALVESKRLKIAKAHHSVPSEAMSVLWLFPQLVLVGVGESFHFPAQVAFYFQQFPHSLRGTSTAMISMILGLSFYLSSALIDQVRRSTGWLPDDINHGRLDRFYWMLAVLGSVNFGYYLLCSTLYKNAKG